MKVYKKLLVIGLISAMALTTVACSGEKKAENTASETKVESSETTESTKADTKEYELYEITEKPEILKEFTGMDADYASYLKSNPLRVIFLDENMSLTDEIDVYSLPERQDATALYIYSKNTKVVDAKLDEFNGDVNIEGYSYDTLIYNYDNMIENQAKEADFPYDLLNKKDDSEKELKAKFEGKSLNELQDFLKVYIPVQKFSRKDTDKILEVYTIVSEAGYTASQTINVIVKDNNIEKLYIDESYKPSNDPIETLKAAK